MGTKLSQKSIWLLLFFQVTFVSGCLTIQDNDRYNRPAVPEVQYDTSNQTFDLTNVKILKVGESANGNGLNVTVNKVRFASKIDEQNSSFWIFNAPVGANYVIIDFSIENIMSNRTDIALLYTTFVIDQDNNVYEIAFNPTIGLAATFKSPQRGEILRGTKGSGESAYLVPINVRDLKFIYKFDDGGSKIAVFDIK